MRGKRSTQQAHICPQGPRAHRIYVAALGGASVPLPPLTSPLPRTRNTHTSHTPHAPPTSPLP